MVSIFSMLPTEDPMLLDNGRSFEMEKQKSLKICIEEDEEEKELFPLIFSMIVTTPRYRTDRNMEFTV